MKSEGLETLRSLVLADEETPEPVRRALAGGASLESIHLDGRGRWWHEGEGFVNERLAQLFSRSLFQTERGLWFLRVGQQSYPVTVSGTGAFAERMRLEAGRMLLSLTTGETVEAPSERWWTDGKDLLGVRLSDGRDVRLIGAAYQTALAWVREAADGWRLALPLGEVGLGGPPEPPRGRMLTGEAPQG